MRKISIVTLALLFLTAWTATGAYAQANGSLGGSVQDSTKALIPGVLITLTNTETGIVDTRITNDSGTFNFPSVPAGTYKLTGDLQGFRQAVNPAVPVGTSAQVRVDLTMQIGKTGDAVTVSIADAPLTVHETSSSVGEVLEADRIRTLPLVNNNVLDLLTVLPGYRESQQGAPFDTVGGLGLDTVNTTINGMTTNSSRNSAEVYGRAVFAPMVINPDMVGEIRLILAPVDAELGRGNSQVQIQTRSGTNRYSGSGVWNIQNTALNANSWARNHQASFANGKQVSNSSPLDWKNIHQLTGSFGGPIIKNKTFFFFLYDKNINHSRTEVTTTVLTDTARQGIFRYYAGFNPLNAVGNPVFGANCSTTGGTISGACAFPSVDYLGNPIPTSAMSDPSNVNLPYTGQGLMCFSIYGNVLANGTPFSQDNCPGGTAIVHAPWDAARPYGDTTGQINRVLSYMPRADDFSALTDAANGTPIGDGLNTAAHRYVRGSKKTNVGGNTLYASTGSNYAPGGAGDYNNRWQTNFKVDHNINQKNRVSVQLSYQSDQSSGVLPEWETGFNGEVARNAYLLTVNGTSTISANIVNEARFGGNYTRQRSSAPWANPNSQEYADAAAAVSLIDAGISPVNGKTYPVLYSPQAPGNGFRAVGNNDQANTNPLFSFSDTLRWTHGKHAFSFGGEYRRPITTGYVAGGGATAIIPAAGGGAITGGGAAMTPLMSATTGNTNFNNIGELPGFLGTARTNAVNLNYLLYGSVAVNASGPTMNSWVNSHEDITNGIWQDTVTTTDKTKTNDPHGHQERTQISQEYSFFVKDDFKITKRLTLNLGIRYDINMAPYYTEGMTNRLADDGLGLYGPARPQGDVDILSNWFTPGNLYLSGYGSNAAVVANGQGPLSCVNGVQQNANLPVSNCDPNLLSKTIWIGPGTDNPDLTVRPQKGRWSPAIGFAYQIPWFGEGKTSIRGGWQRTYAGAGGGSPSVGLGGDSIVTTLSAQDSYIQSVINPGGGAVPRALNLTDIPYLIPRFPSRGPGQANIPIARQLGAASTAMYAPDYVLPYTDNLTMSLSRNFSRKITMDLRVVNTQGKKQVGAINLNQFNTFNNPELIHALDVTRAGGDDPYFDTLLNGLNLVGGTSANYGRVGTVTNVVVTTVVNNVTSTISTTPTLNRGSAQVRRLQAANLANGEYAAVVTGLFGTAVTTGNGNPGVASGGQVLPIDPATGAQVSGVTQRVLRNGCDRIANGLADTTVVDPKTGQPVTFTSKCFPENYLLANSQFTTANLNRNYGHSNYTSGQINLTVRPVQGVTVQGTYSLSKTMATPAAGASMTNPLYPEDDYGKTNQSIGREFRANGTVELPIGPNKIVMGNSSGWVARLVEKWQTSFTVNLPQGQAKNLTSDSQPVYANGRPDIVGPWTNPKGEVTWSANPTATNLGSFFAGTPYLTLPDRQCSGSLVQQTVDANNFRLAGSCSLLELGQQVDAGTEGARQRVDGRWVLPLLANPLPGRQGNIGSRTMYSTFRPTLNASASKNFRLTESKSLSIRVDATNVMNHPLVSDPIGLDATNSLVDNFGRITGKGSNAARTFQGQVRFSF